MSVTTYQHTILPIFITINSSITAHIGGSETPIWADGKEEFLLDYSKALFI